ncbi:hypothetical protein HNR46_001485 [Haloferula luteola]|uniref:LTD domain-containing protein n=1 Tax=Haloferula luteola TaxID=595692 RepID=A0A840VBR4_9BACT|nr:lamin tail domain-containing protein [Haloferula luteola]MBB5351249.1 hypothetical protein [Haloferula luteola]
MPWTLQAEELVHLDAAELSTGTLSSWVNSGSLGASFEQSSFSRRPVVEDIEGIRGVTFDGSSDHMVGPIAPASLTGNGSRTVVAWVYNPTVGSEETIVAWGRRNGPDRSLAAFFHGNHDTWGCFGGWGVADVGWSNQEKSGVWTCCTFVYDAETGGFRAYTDGRLSTSKSIGPLMTWSASSLGSDLPIRLAAQSNTDGSVTSINGALSVARLRICDTAFSDGEVIQEFAAEAPDFGLSAVGIVSFASNESLVYSGDPVVLSWQVVGATSVSISPGVEVSEGSPVTVFPAETTTYTLTASDGMNEVQASVAVQVLLGTPVAEGGRVVLEQDEPGEVVLAATDPNDPVSALTWEVIDGPSHGSLSGTAPNLIFTPEPGYFGEDAFSFRVSDGRNDSNVATMQLWIDPPPTAPSKVEVSTGTLSSNLSEGGFVGNLTTEDPNEGDLHSFMLVPGEGDTHNAWFTVVGHQLMATVSFEGLEGQTISIRVRVTDADGLSVEQVWVFEVVATESTVVINEVYYDPPDNGRSEFVELFNPTSEAIDLTGWRFDAGIDYTFPAFSWIEPGGYLVVAMDPSVFLSRFGFTPLGPFSGKLSGDGEALVLVDGAGEEKDRVEYGATFPWPISPGGAGASMELIHPSLDNDLAGSWRGSGSTGNWEQLTYVDAGASGWKWRPGMSEASDPTDAWRQTGFVEDGGWTSYVSPIGYGVISSAAGTLNLNTVISGMQNNYRSIFLRKTFEIAEGEVPTDLLLRFSKDDGVLIWINGVLAGERNMNTTDPTIATLAASDSDTEGVWNEISINHAATFLVEGTNTIAVQVFNGSLGSSDLGFDLELIRPASSATIQPTPGEQNSVFATVAPPQLRQVSHAPEQPKSGEPILITAKASDPEGIGEVRLLYQIVAPGAFIPARFPRSVSEVLANPDGERPVNPEFEDPANWAEVVMVDDGSGGDSVAGDGLFTGVIPGQEHRTLVRYRIEAEDLAGTEVRVPYEDDDALNFACFVYDGVPNYVATTASVSGSAGKVWPKEMLTQLPVYHWLIRHADMLSLQAYNAWEQFPNTGDESVLSARRSEEWEGALVYDGKVYDHVVTRLRGGNSRYGDYDGRFPQGKRHYKFRFHRGHEFQATNQKGEKYPATWKRMALNRMYGTQGGNNWGMPEEVGSTLWRTFGVPAAYTHWIHFRVIDDADEAPTQYGGDFWGLSQAVEEYESGFLETHEMEKGNLYKMSDWIWDADRQRRYQSSAMVSDGSEFNHIRDNLHGAQTAEWLQRYVNYEKWYRYSAVAEGIRHYDLFPYIHEDVRHALKNLAWYFEPVGPDPTRGLCWFLPYDWDASFGPNFNQGWEHANNALYGWDMSTDSAPAGASYVDKPEMKIAHRNVLREFRDLIWQTDQIEGLMDDRAAVISEFYKADMDRWRNAPSGEGSGNDDPLLALQGFSFSKLQDMKNFCFVGWSGSSGPTVGAGGRAAYLDSLADGPDSGLLPVRPTLTYLGDEEHSVNGLAFQTSAFADPQGAGTFAAMEWRIGEIEDPSAPGWQEGDDFHMEYTPVWLSGELETYVSTITIPVGAVKAGHRYRARVRMKDDTGRWSHWSEPYAFTTTEPDDLADLQQNLMITEVMYHPVGPPPASGDDQDFEYLELQNISTTLTLDLTPVRFTKGVDFDFAGSEITELAPGEVVLVVKSRAAFEERYGEGLPIAGEWGVDQNLSNGGEQVKLSYGAGIAIHDFVYDDVAPWPTEPDGEGAAMVLVDPASAPDHALPESWTAGIPSPGVSGGASSAFQEWMTAQNATDPDAEALPGINWLLMYALGADLISPPWSAMPVAGRASDEGGEYLYLQFRRRADATEIDYQVETSLDLIEWTGGAGVVESVGSPVDQGDGTVLETVRVGAPETANSQRFLRLRVVLMDL